MSLDLSQHWEIAEVDLRGKVPDWVGLSFLRADVLVVPPAPIVRVYYSRRGKEQDTGLRVDIDKLVFLDHPAGDAEEVLREEHGIVAAIGAVVAREQEAPSPERYAPGWAPAPGGPVGGVVMDTSALHAPEPVTDDAWSAPRAEPAPDLRSLPGEIQERKRL